MEHLEDGAAREYDAVCLGGEARYVYDPVAVHRVDVVLVRGPRRVVARSDHVPVGQPLLDRGQQRLVAWVPLPECPRQQHAAHEAISRYRLRCWSATAGQPRRSPSRALAARSGSSPDRSCASARRRSDSRSGSSSVTTLPGAPMQRASAGDRSTGVWCASASASGPLDENGRGYRNSARSTAANQSETSASATCPVNVTSRP